MKSMDSPTFVSDSSPRPPPDPDWKEIVAGIQRGDDACGEILYSVFAQGIRYLIARQLGWKDLDDRVHDAFLTVLDAINHHELREPEKLMGFVQTIVKRQIVANIRLAVKSRGNEAYVETSFADAHADPEQNAAWREQMVLMKATLRQLTRRDRELLTRFYLEDQSETRICDEMRLTATQFRLYKSRAKRKVGSLGLSTLRKKPQPQTEAPSVRRAS
jgi:RNA polymerase sigma-70 factor (ECF subfamily)